MSDEFKAILNKDGKFEMNSIIPENEDDIVSFFWENPVMWEKYEDFSWSNFSDDFTVCDISYKYNSDLSLYEETHRVEIVYNYDEKVKNVMDKLIAKLPEWEVDEGTGDFDPYYFYIRDLELINYWSNCDPEEFNEVTLIDYSGEFKELLGYKNFKIGAFDPRAGFDGDLVTSAMGFAVFNHKNVLYGTEEIAFRAQHIIYVPDDTADTREAIIEAVQARIDAYLGEGKAEIIGYEDDILDFLTAYDRERVATLQQTLTEKKAQLQGYIAQVAEATEAMGEYETQQSELQKIISELDSKVNVEYPELISQKQELWNIASGNVTNYEMQKEELTNSVSNITQMLETFNKGLTEEQTKLETVASEDERQQCLESIKYYEGEIATYTSKLEADREALTKCEADLKEQQQIVSELEATILQCNTELQSYRTTLDGYYSDLMELNSAWDAANQQRDDALILKNNAEYEVMNCENELSYAQGYLDYIEDEYNNEDGEMHFLTEAAGGYAFCLDIADQQRWFVAMKDSDKMIIPEYKSSDASTDVSVESTDSSVPLDTLISVDKMTEGKEYDEIMDVLKVGNHETFDIKLFSGTLNNYITKLSNGKFQVKIPIGATLKDKNLIVYYVDEKLQVHEYEVRIADGYAAFETDHFSVYTLADKVTSVQLPVASLEAVADADKGLTVETSKAIVTLDTKTLEKIVADAGTEVNVVLAVDEIKEDALNTKQKDAIKDKDVELVISAEILCNNKVVSNFDGGKVKVQIPFTIAEGAKASDYKLIHIGDDGKIEDIATTYKDGCLVVELEHFSEYAIVRNSVAGSTTTSDNTQVWVWVGLLAVAMTAVGSNVLLRKRTCGIR